MHRIVTMTTDFGQSDYDAGVLAGVVWGIAPEAKIVHLSHSIARHDVLEAALLLERCTPYFPESTIHVVVVDPGVGTPRRGIAARFGSQFFVGPDNGLITRMYAKALRSGSPVEIVHLDRAEFWNNPVSAIFHGRDVFAPVAGHLAAGAALTDLGVFINNPILLDIPKPSRTPSGWLDAVMHVDSFGNLSTNLESHHLEALKKDDSAGQIHVRVKGIEIPGWVRTFGDASPGDLVVLFDSAGKLSICVVNGNAAAKLGVQLLDPVEVVIE